jgi:hypothetical protein
VTVEGDALGVPGAEDVCAVPNLYSCDVAPPSSGAGSPSIVRGRQDLIAGGLAPGAVRITVSVDYAIDDDFLVGVRAGTALRDDGFHAEARGTYLLGVRPLTRSGLAPAFELGAGLAQYSASVPVSVVWQTQQGQTIASANAHRMERPLFAAVGAGLRYTPTQGLAIVVYPLRGAMAAGSQTPLFVLAPELGVQLGF